MNLFVDAIAWIFSGEPGAGLAPIGVAILEHLWFTFFSVAVAAAVAIPIGWLIGHTGKGSAGRLSNDPKVWRQRLNPVAMTHPDIQKPMPLGRPVILNVPQ